jgi:hypothetical protein
LTVPQGTLYPMCGINLAFDRSVGRDSCWTGKRVEEGFTKGRGGGVRQRQGGVWGGGNGRGREGLVGGALIGEGHSGSGVNRHGQKGWRLCFWGGVGVGDSVQLQGRRNDELAGLSLQ